MSNPTELSGANITPMAGTHGGRAPNAILTPNFLPLLERQGSTISDEKQPELQLIDMDNEYFLVRFANEEDFVKVQFGGPWVVYGSYLTVQPWSRNFSINIDHLDKVMVWVRLPKLLYRYYTKSLFRYITNAIGKVVCIDYNTEDGRRSRFARLAVIVDLHKPLVSGIIIDGMRQDIKYEGLPTICFTCGKYGHSKEECGKERKEEGVQLLMKRQEIRRNYTDHGCKSQT
ncbi:hypothetical protein GQ457_01G027840 [Hibiscus cannabinus]